MPEIIGTFEITTLDNLDKWFLNKKKKIKKIREKFSSNSQFKLRLISLRFPFLPTNYISNG